MTIPVHIYKMNKSLFVTFQQKTHVNWDLRIVFGYHLLINLSITL